TESPCSRVYPIRAGAAIPCRELPNRSTPRTIETRHEHLKTHGETVTKIDPHELAGRYVAVWNEPDAERRRKAIHELSAKDSAQTLPPPPGTPQSPPGAGLPLRPARSPGARRTRSPGDPRLRAIRRAGGVHLQAAGQRRPPPQRGQVQLGHGPVRR